MAQEHSRTEEFDNTQFPTRDCTRMKYATRVLVAGNGQRTRSNLCAALRASVDVDEADDSASAVALLDNGGHSVIVADRTTWMQLQKKIPLVPDDRRGPVVIVTLAPTETAEGLDWRVVHGLLRTPVNVDEVERLVRGCLDIQALNRLETMCLAGLAVGSSFITIIGA
jgi:hypothetical protein